MITRRRLLLGAAPAIAYPVFIEPRWLEVTHTPVSLASAQSIRILHLTDMHASWAVPLSSIASAIETGLAEHPDLACLTGDYITHRSDFDSKEYIALLKRLSAAVPTFAVLGNHDGGSWAQQRHGYPDHKVVESLLDQAGIELLHNRSQQLTLRGHAFTLVGVGDLWSDEIDTGRAFRGVAMDRGPVILMSHNPDSKESLARVPWHLMLSGHTHGGQVIIPFDGPRYAPVNDLRFVAGLRAWEDRQIYTSRGVGNLGGVRFRCRPEVTLLDVDG